MKNMENDKNHTVEHIRWVSYTEKHIRWKLRVVLICISLMIKDVEHFFRYFSAIRYSSGETYFFISEPHFLVGLFDFL